jgi:hypothetical protein
MRVKSIIWKIPVVTVALLVAILFASQAGWSGAEVIVTAPIMEWWDTLGTSIIFVASAAIAAGAVMVIFRLAKHVLWLAAPVLLYVAVVLGAWNGYASSFDATRATALQQGYANAYALQHMSARGLYLTCNDERVELSDDAKPVCARAAISGASSER